MANDTARAKFNTHGGGVFEPSLQFGKRSIGRKGEGSVDGDGGGVE